MNERPGCADGSDRTDAGSGSLGWAAVPIRRMRVRRTATLLTVLALVSLSVAPAAGATRGQLDDARSTLDQLDARLDTAMDEVDAADARVADARAELTAVRHDLIDARHEAIERHAAEVEARRDAASATRRVQRIADALAQVRSRLDARAADAYVHGSADTPTVLLRGITQADNTHDVAVAVKTVENILAQDTDLVDKARQLASAAEAARSDAQDAYARASQATDEARARQARVHALVQRRTTVLDRIRHARDQAAAVARRIAADRAAQQRLVARLEQALDGLGNVLRTPDPGARLDGPSPAWAGRLPVAGRRFAPAIVGAARRAGLAPRLLAALVWTESAFHPTAVSPVGAIGLAQLMPATARRLGVDPHDPVQNLLGGAHYVRAQIARFDNVRLGLAAYNAGPGRVAASGDVPAIVETQLYVLRIVHRFQRLTG